MIRMWLAGREIDPAAGPGAEHPLVRWGEGVFESMRASGQGIPLLDRHLARLSGSLDALAIPEPPSRSELAAAIGELPAGAGRLRLTAAADRLIIAERAEVTTIVAEPRALAGALMPGEWAPGRRAGEHKTVSYIGYRDAARRASLVGADVALLADSHGRLGEADRGNLIAVIGGAARTPPVRGILPGIARAWALERQGLGEEAIKAADRDAATEIVTCNAVEGFASVTTIDGVAVGDGEPGPYARAAQAAFSDLFR